MKLLRVQNALQIGPYFTNRSEKPDAVIRMQEKHNHGYSESCHPPAHIDKGILRCMKPEERCGFLNESQLHSWFSNEELKMLEENGFSVVEVEGKITAKGKHQVLFIPIDAKN